MIFRRKGKDEAADPVDAVEAAADAQADAQAGDMQGAEPSDSEPNSGAEPRYDRSGGPFDSAEIEVMSDDGTTWIDLGSLLVPVTEDIEVRIELDDEQNPVAVTLLRGEGGVQVVAFAAPRTEGAWSEARAAIKESIVVGGGTLEESDGPFGPELRAVMVGTDEHGAEVQQPVRFAGVDGPRWLLRGVFLGAGVTAESAGALEEVFRAVVVVRGDTAMPPGVPLPIVLPEAATEGEGEQDSGVTDPEP